MFYNLKLRIDVILTQYSDPHFTRSKLFFFISQKYSLNANHRTPVYDFWFHSFVYLIFKTFLKSRNMHKHTCQVCTFFKVIQSHFFAKSQIFVSVERVFRFVQFLIFRIISISNICSKISKSILIYFNNYMVFKKVHFRRIYPLKHSLHCKCCPSSPTCM